MGERLLIIGIAVGIQVILAMSVNLISGYARQLSLGHAAFAGIGAYTSALLALHWELSFWLVCPLSLLMTGGLGLLLGLPILRMPRYYVLTMTLGVHMAFQELLRSGLIGGAYSGLGQIPAPRFLDADLEAPGYAVLLLGAMALCIVVDRWFWHGNWGQVLRHSVMRQALEETALATRRATLAAFVMSAALAGLAGSLLAHFERFISPDDFDLSMSLFMLALVVCGGMGSLYGTVLATLLLGGGVEIIPELAGYRFLGAGIIFLAVGAGFPRGFAARYGRRMAPQSTKRLDETSCDELAAR